MVSATWMGHFCWWSKALSQSGDWILLGVTKLFPGPSENNHSPPPSPHRRHRYRSQPGGRGGGGGGFASKDQAWLPPCG